MTKHILVISQYFYPEQFRINDICVAWIQRGYKVTVVTGIPNYPEGKYYSGYGLFKKNRENFNGVDIIRLPIFSRGSSSIRLVLNYLSFVVSGFIWKLFTSIHANYVFIFEVSPMTQALPGVWFAKKRNIPCYLYVQDLWPENVEIVTGIKNTMILNLIGKMVDYIYCRCNKIFTTSQSFIESIHKRGVELNKLEYWPQFAEDFYRPLEKEKNELIGPDDVFNVIFTGNIGTAQGLDILPKAMEIIKKSSSIKVRFNIVGDGRFKDKFVELVKEKQLENYFNFIPRLPSKEIPKLMAACDVAFISLADSPLFSKTIPAKLQSYMASGLPIIAVATGETENIIKSSNSGLCSEPNNPQKLADNMITLSEMGKKEIEAFGINARHYYEKNFDKKILLDRMDYFFNI